jgi:beta-RFAP synthase
MTDRVIRIIASSRLHFGMLSVNQPRARRYGGVGAMVDAPTLELVIRAAAKLEAEGPLADRALQAARLATRSLRSEGQAAMPPCRIEVVQAPPLHVGLGTGTQLAMAVAAGLGAWWDRAPMSADGLARCVGRGKRSAIGLYGFACGGLLYESGKSDDDEISPLVRRVAIPPAWRFVLARPRGERGLCDEAERRAFADLPPVPVERTETLRNEAVEHLLPAAAEGKFEEFSESLYRFGHLAGLSFAARQGGAFAGARLASLVEWIRDCGVRGVGQSSWGPTLFAVLPDASSASDVVGQIRNRTDWDTLELTVASPENHGARVKVVSG